VPRKVFVAGEILTAADVNTNLMDQAVMVFADAAARTTAIPSPTEGMVTYLSDSNTVEAYNGSAFVNVASVGTSAYRFVSTVYFTSSGTFSKATYPWLRAIRVKCVGGGGGGGGGGIAATGLGAAGGGSGGYAESFTTDIAGLDATVTVTRGGGGPGGVAGDNTGGDGTLSSFGSLASADGGGGGTGNGVPFAGLGGAATVGDLTVDGSDATTNGRFMTVRPPGNGAPSVLGGSVSTPEGLNGNVGVNGKLYGGGGSGGYPRGTSGDVAGGAGANGIVIVELYA